MVYVAVAKTVPVLGQDFVSYLDEENKVVFSQKSAAEGLGIDFRQMSRGHISDKLKDLRANYFATSERSNKGLSHVDGSYLQSKGSSIRKLKVEGSDKPINVVTMALRKASLQVRASKAGLTVEQYQTLGIQ